MASALGPSVDWEDEGRLLAPELDGISAAVVVGRDPVAAAKVALGIGRVQARRRRVAIGDLVGEISALQALVPAGEGHGLVDSFLYGVSLTKIAHPIDAAKNLYVLPSGMEPIDYEAILRSDRWSKLTSGFKEVEALLLILVPARAPGLDALVESVDGAIVVGDERRSVPGRVLATVRPAADPDALDRVRAMDDSSLAAVFDPPRSRRRFFLIGAIALVVVVLIAALLLWTRSASSSNEPGGAGDSVPAPSEAPAASTSDSAAGVAAPPAAAGDSTGALAWTVELFKFTSLTDATAQVTERAASGLPTPTYQPLILGADSARFFSVMVGALREQAQAESLLASLRGRGILPRDRGSVVRAPLALLIQRGVSAETAPGLVNAYHASGLPVYALLQPDGTASLFAGAFATASDAETLAARFRADGERPTVAYRTGRVF